MNTFENRLQECGLNLPKADRINVLLVHVGYRCDLRCTHCYVDASPDRTEEMSLETINKILHILKENDEISAVDITGGAPELNPHYKYFIKSATALGKKVMVRSNLTVLSQPDMQNVPEFWVDNRTKVFVSLPCYTEQGVDSQRGKGTYKKVISALKMLNGLGYGQDGTGLELDISFNPPKASRAPDQKILETTYKAKLFAINGIIFNNLVAISNVPIGRLRKTISDEDYITYLKEVEDNFNPDNLNHVLCKEQLCISHDGRLFDCGFNQMQEIHVKSLCADIDNFDYDVLSKREIATSPTCFICTAGSGLGCVRSSASGNK